MAGERGWSHAGVGCRGERRSRGASGLIHEAVEVLVDERVLGLVDFVELLEDGSLENRNDLLKDRLDCSERHVGERNVVGRAASPLGGRDGDEELVDVAEETRSEELARLEALLDRLRYLPEALRDVGERVSER